MELRSNQKVFYCNLYYHSIEKIYKILENCGDVTFTVNELPMATLQEFKSINISYISKLKLSSLSQNIDVELKSGRLILTKSSQSQNAQKASKEIETILDHNNKKYRKPLVVLNFIMSIALLVGFMNFYIPYFLLDYLLFLVYNSSLLLGVYLINRSFNFKISSNVYNTYQKYRANFVQRNQDTILIAFGIVVIFMISQVITLIH